MKRSQEDVVKKRREYLWLKTETHGLSFFGSAIAAVSVLASAAMIYLGLRLLLNAGVSADLLFCLFFLSMTLSLGVLGVWLWRPSSKRANALAYVPPVAEQIAAMPAEEILVRGSEEPSAAPGELLRAARTGAETEAGELVRASQVSPESVRGLLEPRETLASIERERAELQLREQSEVVQGRG